MRNEKVLTLVQLSCVVGLTLFFAGVVVPDILRNYLGEHTSLQTATFGAFSFSYKVQNVFSAVVGVIFGGIIALVATSQPKPMPRNEVASELN